MKKTTTLIALAVAGTFAFAQDAQRMVLVEEFTQASCPPCAAQNPAFNALLSANTSKVIQLKYQTSWPGVDPMNAQTQSWVGPRVTYYGVSGVPHGLNDGVPITNTCSAYVGAPACETQAKIDAAYAVAAPFTINLTHTMAVDYSTMDITVVITATQNFTFSGAGYLRVAMRERQINFSSPPGSNGEMVFYGVMRKMMPNATGTSLAASWTTNQTQTITLTAQAVPAYIYDKNQLDVVAWIQDDGNKSVQQAAQTTPVLVVNDAGVTAVTNVPLITCSTSFTPTATIKNFGSATLTACTINYQVDANTPATFNWSGSLATNSTANVTLPTVNSTAGAHTFKVWTTVPNGQPDYNNANDQVQTSFNMIGTPVTPPIVEGFQNVTFPPANWIRNNPDNGYTWNRVTTCGGFGNSTASAQLPFYFSPSGQIDELFAPAFNFSSAISGAGISFNVAYAQYSTENDRLQVQVSTDCGVTWTDVYNKAGSTLMTANPITSSFTPTAAQWRAETVSLNTYIGQANVLLKFKGTSNYGNNLYIDDINIHAGPLGIANVLADNSLNVYPNPSSGLTNVEVFVNQTENIKLTVYNVLGKVVYAENKGMATTGEHLYTIDGSDFPAGVYFVTLQAGDSTVTKKVSIER